MADSIPGNTTSTKTLEIGASDTSSIDFLGDTDWWKVSLVYGYSYQILLSGSQFDRGTLYDPYLTIYNSAGILQFSVDDLISGVLRDSVTNLIPSASGDFFISAQAYGSKYTGSYTISILKDQLASISSIEIVSVNSITGINAITTDFDTSDWYRVNLTSGIQYQFDLIGSTNDGATVGLTLADPFLFLRNSAGIALAANDSSGLGGNSRIFYTPTTSGIFFLDVQASDTSTSGSYRLIVNSTPTSGALTLGAAQTGSVSFNGDVDRYSISLVAGVAYSFSLDGTTLLDPYLEVQDSAGTNVRSDDDSGPGLNAFLTYTPTVSGTYYHAARESGNNATGTYSARAWQLPSVSIATASVTEGNLGTTDLVFTLTLSVASPIDVTVTAATQGTATATYSSDYTALSGMVTIVAGQTSATFTVKVLGDTLFEPTESLHVLLSSPQNAVLGSADTYGFIVDNDNPYSLPSDPLARLQWYLYPTTGINVFPVWADYTGAGIRVAVFDQGIDPTHPDLDGNLLASLGRKASNLSAGGAPILTTDNHGTMVAGTIAAELNGLGVVGVAYDAKLVSIYNQLTIGEIANAFTYAKDFDVLNNSWGFAPQKINYFSLYGNWAFADNFLSPTFSGAAAALTSIAATGRNGLGTVVVQSAGNSFKVGDDTNLHNFQNSQYIITVAATGYSGNITAYSSPGASVLIAAPGGGGTDDLSDIFTTDRVGTAGEDIGDYASTQGTSFSAPIVAGIVALMLEANPNLGYRDVQEILAYSAREIGATSNDWRYNGATNWNGGGLHYDALSHNLGFGLVDALAAVRLAETWGSVPHTAANREIVTATKTVNRGIPDNSSSVTDIISVTRSIDIERVEVTLNVTHPYIGDLEVLLSSPSGTTSFLLWRPQQNPLSAYGTSQNNINFTFDTVLNWGDSSVGTWVLSIFDKASPDVGTFDSWTLNLIGKPAAVDDTYIYTNEFSEATSDQSARGTLTDTSGTDTLNASAVTGNLVLNLGSGGVSSIDGRSLTMASSTVIENAYGGDGNDRINGSSVDNTLYGMRGNDTLDGGAGTDTAGFSGNRASYTISKTSTGLAVSSAAEGVDTLANVERLKFADTAIALDTSGVGGQAYRVYKAAFNRTPDLGGLGFWMSGMDGGVSLNAVAQGFVNSAEFKAVYGASPTNAQIVTRFYDNVLGRAAESGGYNYWLGVLNSGQGSVAGVLAAFSESPENQAALIGVIGNGFPYTPYG